jgi:biopolymer transport protein TolR
MAVNFSARPVRGGGPRGRRPMMADINVTPMVDVMLVLLVVFMVTAPLLTVGVPVDLPQTKAPALNEPKEPLVISVNAEGKIFLQNAAIDTDDELVPRLQAITNNNPDASIYVRGDKTVNYGRVLGVMGQISAAGFTKVSLIAELPGTTAPGAAPPAPASRTQRR